MPEEEAKQTKLEVTTGVPRDANWWDRGGLTGIISGVGLATYLVVVQFPKMLESIDKNTAAMVAMKDANEAHYRAMSDDRRVQLDEVRTRLVDIAHNVEELRRVNRPEFPKSAAPSKQ